MPYYLIMPVYYYCNELLLLVTNNKTKLAFFVHPYYIYWRSSNDLRSAKDQTNQTYKCCVTVQVYRYLRPSDTPPPQFASSNLFLQSSAMGLFPTGKMNSPKFKFKLKLNWQFVSLVLFLIFLQFYYFTYVCSTHKSILDNQWFTPMTCLVTYFTALRTSNDIYYYFKDY